MLAAPRNPDRMQLGKHDMANQALAQLRVFPQRKRDVFEDVEVREQRAILEQHAEPLAQQVELGPG